MRPKRILIVKTSSMGDVVHALPVVADIHAHLSGVQIDWLVEAPFAAIPECHPGVRRVIPMALRRWRSQMRKRSTWAAMSRLRTELRAEPYDLVLDLQGLLKSALWARQTGAPVAGYDRNSIREPLAAWFYRHQTAVPRDWHAVKRCRALAAAHLGYELPQTAPQFGLQPPAPSWKPGSAYGLLIPSASRASKLWPERHWVSVGKRMRELGLSPVICWGKPEEQSLAESIAASCEGDVPPFLKVRDMVSLLAGAHQVVGLDTGLTHLAAALGRPTLGIYCDHEPGLAGITGPGRVASIGGKGQVPSRADVLALFEMQLQR